MLKSSLSASVTNQSWLGYENANCSCIIILVDNYTAIVPVRCGCDQSDRTQCS